MRPYLGEQRTRRPKDDARRQLAPLTYWAQLRETAIRELFATGRYAQTDLNRIFVKTGRSTRTICIELTEGRLAAIRDESPIEPAPSPRARRGGSGATW